MHIVERLRLILVLFFLTVGMLFYAERALCLATLCTACPLGCKSCTLSASLVPECDECNEMFTLTDEKTCFRTYLPDSLIYVISSPQTFLLCKSYNIPLPIPTPLLAD